MDEEFFQTAGPRPMFFSRVRGGPPRPLANMREVLMIRYVYDSNRQAGLRVAARFHWPGWDDGMKPDEPNV